MIGECVKSAVLERDHPLSIEVCGAFSIDNGNLCFKNVVDANSVFYEGQAIQILHHVRTIVNVDLLNGLLMLNHPLPGVFARDIGDSVFVDPNTRMVLTNGDGQPIARFEKDGAIHSAWMDRLVARVNDERHTTGLGAGIGGWSIETSADGLRFVNAMGAVCMELQNNGTLVLQ